MAYNTGNPIGSGDPRDLRDNAENLDDAMNTTDSVWTDRFGVTRKTFKAAENAVQQVEDKAASSIAAIEQDAADVESARDTAIISINALDDEAQQALDDAEVSWESRFVAGQDDRADRFETAQDSREAQFVQLMISGGYTGTGADGAIEEYASGITVSAYKEIIRENGEFWRAAAGTVLPYTTTGAGMPESGAFVNVGDGALRQDLVQPVATFNNVADMKNSANLDVGRKCRSLGYYAPGDGGGNDYEIVAAGTGTDDGGSFIDLPGSGLQARGLFVNSEVNARQFGAGNGADDTDALSSLFDFSDNIFFPEGRYRVTSLTWSGFGKKITFDRGAELYGISEVPQDQILLLHNFRSVRINNLRVASDGNEAVPVYHQNYNCAVRATSDNSSSPTQFVTIDGMYIRYIKAGFVSGNLLGQTAQASFPQSEIFIRDYRQRGVMQAFYSNAINGYITMSGCALVTQKFEATDWWDDSEAFNLRADAGDVVSVGDEFQAARSQGFNIYGKAIKIYSPVWEHSCINYLTGNVSIEGMTNGYFGSNALAPFVIEAEASGRLVLTDCNLRRPNGTASSSRSVFCDVQNAPAYRVDIADSVLKEFAYITNNADAHFVRGGVFYSRNVEVDNSGSTVDSYRLDDALFNNTSFDTTGQSMSTTEDFSDKGGWSSSSATADGASFFKYTADTPTEYSSAIRFRTTGNSKVVQTPNPSVNAFPVQANRDYQFSCYLKRLGDVSNFTILIQWYDFAGTSLSVVTVFAHNADRLNRNGFDKWQRLGALAKPPNGAVNARISLSLGSTCDVALTGIRII